ncbi:MAG TPA: ferritin-like domain-containing protein [Acidimicrobiales bacterium]|jgi:starvation-inducible DNA-binding protein
MESEYHVDIFWSSAHPWERLGQRFWPRLGVGSSASETLRLFSIDQSAERCRLLNDALADSIVLYGLYNKEYWLVRGEYRSELGQLLRQHARELVEFIDQLAQRVHALGGVPISDPRHVAEVTSVPSTSSGFEDSPTMMYRILEAHRIIIQTIHCVMISDAENSDEAATQRLMSDMLSRHEHQAWLVAEHLVGTLTHA